MLALALALELTAVVLSHPGHRCCGVVAKRCGVVGKRGIVLEHGAVAKRGVVAELDVGVVVTELGVVVTEHAPSGVALLPRLASSPERAVVVAERAPSGTALLLSGVVSSPERGVVVIVAAINNRATTKRYFVGVKSGSRGYWKWEQVSPGRRE
jgi:hypothetical protein